MYRCRRRVCQDRRETAALGKMVAGCRFQTYYPITPASDDSEFLEANEILDLDSGKKGSTVVVQTEDEIAAIAMAIGSALTGARSATATSGPGFSLMAEALGWAGIIDSTSSKSSAWPKVPLISAAISGLQRRALPRTVSLDEIKKEGWALNISRYVLPPIGKDIPTLPEAMIFSAFVLGYVLFEIPGGWLADRFGRLLCVLLGA